MPKNRKKTKEKCHFIDLFAYNINPDYWLEHFSILYLVLVCVCDVRCCCCCYCWFWVEASKSISTFVRRVGFIVLTCLHRSMPNIVATNWRGCVCVLLCSSVRQTHSFTQSSTSTTTTWISTPSVCVCVNVWMNERTIMKCFCWVRLRWTCVNVNDDGWIHWLIRWTIDAISIRPMFRSYFCSHVHVVHHRCRYYCFGSCSALWHDPIEVCASAQ